MYLVKFSTVEQVSPEDLELEWKEKLFDESTTLKEVEEWAKSKLWGGQKMMPEVRLSKPERNF